MPPLPSTGDSCIPTLSLAAYHSESIYITLGVGIHRGSPLQLLTNNAEEFSSRSSMDVMSICRTSACLPSNHIPTCFSARPFVFSTRRTIELPSKRPELRSNGTCTRTGLVSCLFTASNIATAALVGIWSFGHPHEFGADLIKVGMCP